MWPFAIPFCWRNHHMCAPVSCLTFWSLPRLRHDRRHQLPEANTFDLKMFYMIIKAPYWSFDQVCQEVLEHGESQDFMTQQYESYKPHFNVLHCFALSGSLLSGKCRAAHAAAAFKEPLSKTTPWWRSLRKKKSKRTSIQIQIQNPAFILHSLDRSVTCQSLNPVIASSNATLKCDQSCDDAWGFHRVQVPFKFVTTCTNLQLL